MKFKFDLYSGRPNPIWQLSPKAGNVVFELINDSGLLGVLPRTPFPARLGYRGLKIELTPDIVRKYNVSPWINLSVDLGIDQNLLFNELAAIAWMSDFLGLGGYFEMLQKILKQFQKSGGSGGAKGGGSGGSGGKKPAQTYGPCSFEMLPYDPAPWNDPAFKPTNNCYAYASGQRKAYRQKPQPGEGSGAMFTDVTGADVAAAAKRDGAHDVGDCFPDTEAPRHLVALVIWPGEDYHWYRKHPDCWGHKPGSTTARNVDNSGTIIANPQTCDRGDYTEFMGYMLLPKSLKIAST